MPSSAADPLGEIKKDLLDPSSRVIAFVGAGLSHALPAELPNWVQLLHRLCDRCSELGKEDIAEKCRNIASVGEFRPRFMTACFDEIEEALGRVAYESEIQRLLTPASSELPPSISALARVPFTGTITTNMDRLIEDACERWTAEGERPYFRTILTSSSGRGQGNLARQANWLWKIHGTVELPESWIFTSRQYAKSIYANEPYLDALAAVIQGARVVFLGFGGTDIDIDLILEALASSFGGRPDPHFLLARDSTHFDVHRLANSNIKVVEYGGPEDHSGLTELLQGLPRFSDSGDSDPDIDLSEYGRWLENETGFIDIRGIGSGDGRGSRALRFPIQDLYTSLCVLTEVSDPELEQGRITGESRVDLREVVEGERCVAIMGDPGAGKTTFLRYVARSYLADPSRPLPFYFSLADVHELVNKLHPRGKRAKRKAIDPEIFIDFLLDVSARRHLGLTKEALKRRVSQGGCIWLMDSLDLIPSHDDREALVQTVEAAASKWKNCRFVIASRPRAMRGRAVPAGFDVVGIDQMHEEEIRFFLETWTDLLFTAASFEQRREYSDGLLSRIRDAPDLRALAKNPVMLTCIAVVHYNEKHLPEGRADLLESVIHWLIYGRDRSHTLLPDPKRVEVVYRELALRMMETKGGRRDQIGRGSASDSVAKHFGGDKEAALEFLTDEETETGVVVRRGEGDLAFWHFWFQEYLAAKEVAGRTDDEEKGWWSVIRDRIDDVGWREVVSFVPACLVRLGSDRVDLFFRRLAESCQGADLVAKSRRVGLGGSIVGDLQAIGYEPANVLAWSRIREEILPIFDETLGQQIPLDDRREAAIAYGLGGDPRLRNFEDTWVRLPGGRFMIGTQPDNRSLPKHDPSSTEWESPVLPVDVPPFEIRRYPITVQEFAQFVEDGGYSRRGVWSENAWEWRIRNEIVAPQDWEQQTLCPNCPVTGVSWHEASAYANWLTEIELLRDLRYRLPTEAEWEYAATRGLGPGQVFPWGERVTQLDGSEANFASAGLRKKTPVGLFPRSRTADGIDDLFGNVEEWCADTWYPDHAGRPKDASARVDDSIAWKVARGGSAIRYSRLCRPSYRSHILKENRYWIVGFRLVRDRASS